MKTCEGFRAAGFPAVSLPTVCGFEARYRVRIYAAWRKSDAVVEWFACAACAAAAASADGLALGVKASIEWTELRYGGSELKPEGTAVELAPTSLQDTGAPAHPTKTRGGGIADGEVHSVAVVREPGKEPKTYVDGFPPDAGPGRYSLSALLTYPLKADSSEVLQLAFSSDGSLVASVAHNVPNPDPNGHSRKTDVENVGFWRPDGLLEVLRESKL